MQQLRRSFTLAAGIAVIVMVLTASGAGSAIAQNARPLLTLITNDAAHPVPVQPVASALTHLGRPVGDIVQLTWWATSDCFKRIHATGQAAPECYVPPDGRALVITDVQWSVMTGPGNAVHVAIYDLAPVFIASAVASSDGLAALDHQSQTGFIFAPTLRPSQAGTMLLRGYLVPE